MAGRSALQSLRADPIHKQFELSSSPGTSAVAAVARIDGTGLSRPAARAACDGLLVDLVTSVAGDGDWTVRHSPNAAPRLLRGKEQSDIRISTAHSANWVAVGLATHADIGIDVQVHSNPQRTEQIADLLNLNYGGSHRNCDHDNSCGDCHRNWWFFGGWVLREAIAKATGGSVLEKHAVEADLAVACERPGHIINARDFAAIVELVDPAVSFAAVIHHHRAMQHCA